MAIGLQKKNCEVDPIRSRPGENLSEGSYKNFAGFLVYIKIREFVIDENVVDDEINKLHSRMVIGYLVGRRPMALEFKAWLVALNTELQGGRTAFSHFEGKGFFSLEIDSKEIQRRVLMLALQSKQRRMCVLQPWVPLFNPDKPQDLYVLTWMTLRKLPREYLKLVGEIIAQIGTVIGSDPKNPN